MKKLLFGFHRVAGRARGLISSYNRGGGNKKLFRFVDRTRTAFNIPARVIKLFRNPNCNGKLACVAYSNGMLSFVPATEGVVVGAYIQNRAVLELNSKPRLGFSYPLKFLRPGIRISSIEFYPGRGAVVSRASGMFSLLVRHYDKVALLRLPSGEFRFFSSDVVCTVGTAAKTKASIFESKAGWSRWHGRRPVVRGRAMNPVDHPHGGRTNGGIIPTTPWRRWVKGQKTSRSVCSLRLKQRSL